ncbi:MAG: putative rane protein [Micavibrio sp.]|nr:putative rane protein [Micavibrio sp.]
MPGLIPRLKDLFGGGSGMLAYMIANIFQSTRLLPANHPYLSPANMRKYGIRDVFAQAGNNLVFDRKHLDQILIFFTLMLGFVLFFLQFLALGVSLVVQHANALPFGSIFETQYNTTDIAFELLDRVFGIPDIFNSCVAQMMPCGNQPPLNAFPTPFNIALQNLFQYYSVGILVVGVIIFLYYMFVVVVETAQTGTPFGRRFSHIWVPIRLVVAIGLLIPVSHGLNSAQYIVLYAAKEGSGFATNGWTLYNSTLQNGLGADVESLYARPKNPDIWPMLKFMLLVNTCRTAYALKGVSDIQPYLVKQPAKFEMVDMGASYADALNFYNNGDVIIRFGQQDDSFGSENGTVKPFCGEIMIPTQTPLDSGSLIGPYTVQESFFNLILYLWSNDESDDFAEVITHQINADNPCTILGGAGGLDCDTGVTTEFVIYEQGLGQSNVDDAIYNGREAMIAANDMSVTPEILERGWGGAGIWYNRIAEANGVFFSAVNFVPTPTLEPIPLAQVKESRNGADQNVNPTDSGNLNQSNENKIKFGSAADEFVANAMQKAMKSLGDDSTYQNSDNIKKNNAFTDTINLLFGTEGLFTMRENTDIHPLAQLVGLGKGIMDATIRNLFTATIFSVGGGLLSAWTKTAGVGKYSTIFASILIGITTISLTVGFVLYYVLPFLPFMYFFFSVGAWIKTIFEAMVGVPLWALGHLRIDGHGLPGESALDGYFMIFEIFIRPILTVFGLIGGLITFTALAKVLNEIFKLVTDNLTGFDENPCFSSGGGACTTAAAPADMLAFKRNVIDNFFFTIIYTIVIYMMATGSFKMIDQIPSRILRWMGAGAQAFQQHNEAEEGLNRYLIGGAVQMTRQMGDIIMTDGNRAGFLAGKLAGGNAQTNASQPGSTGAFITRPPGGAGSTGSGNLPGSGGTAGSRPSTPPPTKKP